MNNLKSIKNAIARTPTTPPHFTSSSTNPTTVNLDSLAREIKAERMAQGLSQRELAFKAGCSQTTIFRAEKYMGTSLWGLTKIIKGLNKTLTIK